MQPQLSGASASTGALPPSLLYIYCYIYYLYIYIVIYIIYIYILLYILFIYRKICGRAPFLQPQLLGVSASTGALPPSLLYL